jgi:hypothetical protein
MKSLFFGIFLSMGALIASSGTAAAQELTIGSETISSSGVATVDLDISGLNPGTTALGTFDVNVGFNASIVNFASASYGDPILGDQLNFTGLALQSTTPGADTAELFELSLDPSSTLLASQPSSFTLATLTFDAVGTGTSTLALSVNALGDENGNSLPATLQNGAVTVTGGSGGGIQAPEIDAKSAMSGFTLLLGALLVFRGRRGRERAESEITIIVKTANSRC